MLRGPAPTGAGAEPLRWAQNAKGFDFLPSVANVVGSYWLNARFMNPPDVFENRLRPRLLAGLLARLWSRLGRVNEQKYQDKGWKSYAEKLQYKILMFPPSLFSRNRAEQIEREADGLRSARIFSRFCQVPDALQSRPPTCAVTFKHSGNAGDIIYALPAMKALSQGHPAKLFLRTDVPVNGWSETEHPLGKFGLTAEMAGKLKPLLAHQAWLSAVEIHAGEAVDYDLDAFREVPNIKGDRGDIMRWYSWLFAVGGDLSQPWLEVRPPPLASPRIVLARSARYRNPMIGYAFLRVMGEIDFVGTRSEFDEMREILPQLKHVECSDFLNLARIIKAARFFIGNQSFPYSIAEGLRVPRILEVCPQCPNVVPRGENAGEAFFQPCFEKLAGRFWQQTRPEDRVSPSSLEPGIERLQVFPP